MELEHSLTLPVPLEEAWQLLLDLERIVPALPGASLTSSDGDAFTGKVKVKIGSIQLAYAGEGRFAERDEATHHVVIEAAGKDTRGAGTANATISCVLSPAGEETRADIVTDLALTGRPAQFGRGLLNDVGSKIIDQFAANLSAALEASSAPAAAEATSAGSAGTAAEDIGPVDSTVPRLAVPEAEPLDLMSVAGVAVAKRAAGPALAIAVLVLLVVRAVRHRSR